MKQIIKYLIVFLLWNIAAGSFLLLLDPLIGLPLALALAVWFVWGYLLRPSAAETPARRWATLRLRPLEGEALRWSLVAVPVLLLLSWAVGDVYLRIVPVPPESLNPFEPIMRTPEGRFAIAVFAIVVAPIVEEFVFRGLVQRTLERRYGPTRAIATAAAIFSMVHLLPWLFPLHFFLGVAFGFAVFATRSIWTGVILHAANNAAAMAASGLEDGEAEMTGTLWEIGITADLWISLAALILGIMGAAWIARGLLAAREEARLPSP